MLRIWRWPIICKWFEETSQRVPENIFWAARHHQRSLLSVNWGEQCPDCFTEDLLSSFWNKIRFKAGLNWSVSLLKKKKKGQIDNDMMTCVSVCGQTIDLVVWLPLVTLAMAVWGEIGWEDLLIQASVWVCMCSHVSLLLGVCACTHKHAYLCVCVR